MDQGRVPWPTPNELDDEQRALYDSVVASPRATSPGRAPLTDEEGRMHGPFNALLHTPKIGNALQELGTAVRYGAELPDRSRELAILEVAHFDKSAFEWAAHVRVGRRVGLSEEEISAIDSGADSPTFDETEQAVRETTQALLNRRDLTDEQFATATTVLGLKPTLDLVILVGYYQALALVIAAARTPLTEE